MKIQKPKGTLDLLPDDVNKRRHIEEKLRRISSLFNYNEIRTPTFEKTELFKRSIGEQTDVVSKEMYSFNKDEFTLKPEMTAPVIRSFIENNLNNKSPVWKLYYIAKMYRHERPQAGRFREFSQFGVEAIGSNDHLIDTELISLGAYMLNEFGIQNVKFKINTIGSSEERGKYIVNLKSYLKSHYDGLSADSKNRYEKNTLRILDSKDKHDIEVLKNAPVLYEYLNRDTKEHFENVLKALKFLGINFEIDHKLVRGFDYYTSTTFEVVSEDLGSQNAIFGGGRYDKLVEQFGGNPTPAIGFACGLERLNMILEKNNYNFPEEEQVKLYLVTFGESAREFSSKILFELRKKGIKCETDFLQRSIKSQMKEANKIKAKYVIVIGQDELANKRAMLKNMSDGSEKELKLEEILNTDF